MKEQKQAWNRIFWEKQGQPLFEDGELTDGGKNCPAKVLLGYFKEASFEAAKAIKAMNDMEEDAQSKLSRTITFMKDFYYSSLGFFFL